MCFFLYLGSPLTLSEVRSMLPDGLIADLVPPGELRAVRELHPDAQTAARVMHGACSCDLVVQRHAVSREDEAHLRQRYRQLGLSRDRMIRALENHRRALTRRRKPDGHWPVALAAFVAEHARNAGPTLYYLGFSPDGVLKLPETAELTHLTASEVIRRPGAWLPEGQVVMVA